MAKRSPRPGSLLRSVNPANPTAETLSKSLQTAAPTSGLQLHVLNASTEKELNSVFMTLRQLQAEGLVVVSDVFSLR